jgi:2,3-diketo-5-methylthio-1-phosphopentane phosphatase
MTLAADRLHVFTDFDGTIARPDTLMLLTERLGAGPVRSRETGRLLREGAITLRDAVARDVGSIRVPFAEAARMLRDHVTVDPAFVPFARWCAGAGVPLTVLSAGFREIVDLLVPPEAVPGLDVRANRFRAGTWECVFRDGSPFGHDKAAAVREARARGRYVVFVGDGFSDRAPAAAADEVFARAGHDLAAHCRAHGIRCREFETFDDVWRSLATRLAAPQGEAGA